MTTLLSDGLVTDRLAYGCMNLCGTWKAPRMDGYRTILSAYEAGFRLFDHADIYGGGAAEEAFAIACAEEPALRREARLITKAGHVFPAWN